MEQIQPLFTLYSEFIVCLIAAGFLGLFIGWMMHRSTASRQHKEAQRSWEKRYRTLESLARSDAETLAEQLKAESRIARELQDKNLQLSASLKKRDSSFEKSRAEAIELNRHHTNTQERLQRIIQQKDREIQTLNNKLRHTSGSEQAFANTFSADSPRHRQSADQSDGNDPMYADTVAINSTDLLDATIQMPAHEILALKAKSAAQQKTNFNDTLDAEPHKTSESEEVQMEEATVVLDEEALAYARRISLPNRRD